MQRIVFLLLVLALAACNRTESESADSTATPDTAAASDTSATAPDTSGTTPAAATSTASDLNFATLASMANLYEIEASKLAERKAGTPAYDEFARTMVRQHTEIGESYKPIAEKQGLPLPAKLENISPAANFKTLYDELEAAQDGTVFEALYKQQMIATHSTAVQLFETESTSGQDPELKAFAARWLPTVRHHLEMANALPAPR